MKCCLFAFIAGVFLLSVTDIHGQNNVSQSNGMLSPGTDKADKEWCYLAKSTTVIGMPFQSDVTQVTFDGALFTRFGELCFFWGKENKPLLARQKTFLQGWMPVVEYSWKDAGLRYEIEYFSDFIDESSSSPVINFAKIKVTNLNATPATALFKSALRFSGEDHRFESDAYSFSEKFSADWNYEMKQNAVYRNEQLMYTFDQGAACQTVPGLAYQRSFTGRAYEISRRAECCLACYKKMLRPNQSVEWVFKMPLVPVPSSDTSLTKKINEASYVRHRSGVVRYWNDLLQHASQFNIPEQRVENAYKAGIVHTLLATRSRNGKSYQTDGLPYSNFFLTSAPEMTLLYLSAGLTQIPIKHIIPAAIAQQQENGLYFDSAVAHGKIIPAAQGHILYLTAMTILYTQDTAFAKSVYPSVAKGIQFLKASIDSSQYGLLPPCYPFDNEMISGHYSGHNFIALMGLRSCIRVARLLNKKDDEKAWTLLAEKYKQNILKAIDSSARNDGYVPTGLYHYLTGQKAREGFDEYQTDADWENMVLAYPTEVLSPSDPRVSATLNHIRKDYAEGVMTYRHGLYLHQYITSNMIEQYLAMGDSFTALKDFYHQLLHSGSTMECFENLVKPWADRQVATECPPPHAWGNSKQALTVRNLLLMEVGGENGVNMNNRELWLFHCMSPEWVGKGKKVEIKNGITEFGTVNASFSGSDKDATITINSRFHTLPAHYRIRIPYFKKLIKFSSNAREQKIEGDCILLSADATTVHVYWEDNPAAHLHTTENMLMEYRAATRFAGVKDGRAIIETGAPYLLPAEHSNELQPLNFELVKKTFLYEYNRLAKERKVNGAKIQTVEAPALLTEAERKQIFDASEGAALNK
jgi:hypothetical protein